MNVLKTEANSFRQRFILKRFTLRQKTGRVILRHEVIRSMYTSCFFDLVCLFYDTIKQAFNLKEKIKAAITLLSKYTES